MDSSLECTRTNRTRFKRGDAEARRKSGSQAALRLCKKPSITDGSNSQSSSASPRLSVEIRGSACSLPSHLAAQVGGRDDNHPDLLPHLTFWRALLSPVILRP